MRMNTYKIKVVAGLHAQFVYGTFEQLQAYMLRRNNPADIETLEDSIGAAIGNIIWICSSLEKGSINFIKTLVHECSHFADAAESAGAAKEKHELEFKSYVASIIVERILSKYTEGSVLLKAKPTNTASGAGKSQLLIVSLEIFGQEVLFLHCSYKCFETFVKSNQGSDVSELEGFDGGACGNVMWVNDTIAKDSMNFIVNVAHNIMLITGMVVEHLGLEGSEVRAYIAEYIVGKILKHTLESAV